MSGAPPLAGVRVLELGHFIAGPFCARLFADLGADVIKVEPPGKGDPIRDWGEKVDGHAPWWSVHGRNKRALSLDLKQAEGRALAGRLIGESDILIENFRPGQLEKWGFDETALAALRPGLVLVRISGFGQSGPDRDRAAFGVIGEAVGGLRRLTGFPAGTTDLPPARTGISLGDSVAGLYGAFGALAALQAQSREGGDAVRVVDVALSESVLSLMEGCLPEFGLLGTIRQPTGATLPTNAPSNAYPCADGEFVLIAANSDNLFRLLCPLIGRPELADDPRFADNAARCAHAGELDTAIAAWSRTLDSHEAARQLKQANIPATRIYDTRDCAEDPQFRARGMIREVEDPRFGAVLHPAPLPMFSGGQASGEIRWSGPAVGAHREEILGELGLDEAAIADLARRGVI